MSDLQVLQQEVTPWVEQSLRNEDIQNPKITVTGKSEKGEGYLGDIIFVQVTGLNKSNENRELNLVLKIGKKSKEMRKNLGAKDFYLREIYIYEKIFPAFRKFQEDKKIKHIFNAIPKCYGTILLDDIEILVLENLKKQRYELHDRHVSLNSEHIKLILDNYAKFHAISFAMKDQNPEEFDNLTKDYTSTLKTMNLQYGMNEWYNMSVKKLAEKIREIDEQVAKLFLEVFDNKLHEMYLAVLDAEVKESVVIHGDCWNNNFMFKYEGEDTSTPTAVSILDWQVSCRHSPAMDIAYFLYIVSSEEELARFDEFIQFYHNKLSEYMREMGSDPEKIFPFSTLIDHFKNYAVYGIQFVVTTLELILSNKKDAIALEDLNEEMMKSTDPMDVWANRIKADNQNSYRDRAAASLRHYLNYVVKGM